MAQEYTPPTQETLRWVASQVCPDARVVAVTRLHGGITADMDRITVESSVRQDVVLRRWSDLVDAAENVEREAEALLAVRRSEVPAPHLLATDAGATLSGTHCTLTTSLPGQPDLCPVDPGSWLEQLATTQAAIHAVPARVRARWNGRFDDSDRPLDWVTDPGLRQAAHEAATGAIAEETVLVHGDYQHFNVLWSEGHLTGIVDWPTAAMGDRGSDVGHCRLNLAVLFGPEVAADYLTAYERVSGVRVDRRADLRSLLCFTSDWPRFIPRQIAGRAALDVVGMPDRVAATVRATVDGLA